MPGFLYYFSYDGGYSYPYAEHPYLKATQAPDNRGAGPSKGSDDRKSAIFVPPDLPSESLEEIRNIIHNATLRMEEEKQKKLDTQKATILAAASKTLTSGSLSSSSASSVTSASSETTSTNTESTTTAASLASSLEDSPAKELSVLVKNAKLKRNSKKRKLDMDAEKLDSAALLEIRDDLLLQNDGLSVVLEEAKDARSRGRAFFSVVSKLGATSVSSKMKKTGLTYTRGDLKSSQIKLATVLGNLPLEIVNEESDGKPSSK